MADGPPPFETGDHIEHQEHIHPGFYENIETPRTCPCCFKEHYWLHGFSMVLGRNGFEAHPCAYADHWMQDHLRRMACPHHVAEKIKDGIFGALEGNFTTPMGQPTFKPAREGRVAPIVGASRIKR